MKQPAKTDIAVLLLFFNRADTFRQVFEAVKEARPQSCFSTRMVLVANVIWLA